MGRFVVDLYCGAGGVTTGLKAAGWHILAACDNDPIASATYRNNHPEVTFIEDDIRKDETIHAISKAIGDRQVNLLVVCAPCQPFSSQNRKRGNDPRTQLIVRSLVYAVALEPDLIFFENVPGFSTPTYAPVLRELKINLSQLGYIMTEPMVRDAARYGVPQRRRRCIVLAGRSQQIVEAFQAADIECPGRTVRDAISQLRSLGWGEKDPYDRLHRARRHLPIAIERLRAIPKNGGSRKSLPPHLELACHLGTSAFPDVYGRMKWDSVAPTLTTGCSDITRGRFAHPEQNRAITLREAARLQTFPDDYFFHGNASEIARQIGNAVPPAMISAFASAFDAALTVSFP